MSADLAALETLFLGLADKTRLRLLALMADGPVPVAHLVAKTGESQPKISRHLAYLRNSGLVETTRDGKWIYYCVKRFADDSSNNIVGCLLRELSGRNEVPPRVAPPKLLKREVMEVDNKYEPDSEEVDNSWDSPSRADELEIFLL